VPFGRAWHNYFKVISYNNDDMKQVFLFLAMAGLFSCQNGSESRTTTTTTAGSAETTNPTSADPGQRNDEHTPATGNATLAGCYLMTIEKDTATMELKETGNGYKGNLVYKRFEKDGNNGTVNFIQDGPYLKGWYAFNAEGMVSVRQVIMKKTAADLAEGYGDVTVVGDSVFFKYPANLNFEEKHPFIKRNCP